MPPSKRNNRKLVGESSAVQSYSKKPVAKNETMEIDESDEDDWEECSEKEDIIADQVEKASGKKNVVISIRLNPLSREFESQVLKCLSSDSSDEEIIDEKPKETPSRRSARRVEEPVELSDSMKKLDISNARGRKTRSKISVSEETKNTPTKVDKIGIRIARDPNSPTPKYSLRKPSEERTLATPSTGKKDSISIRQTRRSSAAPQSITGSLTPSSRNESGRCLRERSSNISYREVSPCPDRRMPPSVRTRKEAKRELENKLPKTPQKRGRPLKKGTPSRIAFSPVNDSSNENDPSGLEENESPETPKKRGRPQRNKTPSRNALSSVNESSNENYPSGFEGNELSETPQKRGKSQRIKTPSRFALTSVNESSNENDPSGFEEPSGDFGLVSQWKDVPRRRSTRGRKSLADQDTDYVYELNPRKRRSTMTTTPSTNKQTPRKNLVTKRLVGSGRTPVKTLDRNITSTPRGGRRTFTPGMHERSVNVSKPKTSFQEFRSRLHVSFVPKSLPCREAEFNNIFTFLQGKLSEETGGCIYISGVPGTGKTATVNEVMLCLKKLESQGELPSFKFVEINGMKMTEPRQAYVQIFKSLTGNTCTWEEAHRHLHQRFTTPASRRDMTLLLIDELDLLCTKRQDVVYNLLDWPTYKSSRLVVITIANTMDLPERVLMGRVTSRLGLTRLTFQPYNHEQLMEIVKTRLKDSEAFESKAIELVARKVASVSGDARRALDICRRATEIAESSNKECVTMLEVNTAVKEMIANPRVRAIKSCSKMERCFLEAVCSEVKRTGVEQVTVKNVYRQFDTLCRMYNDPGEKVPNITQVLEICRKLASWRLILWESGADLYQSILMNVTADDIYFSNKKMS